MKVFLIRHGMTPGNLLHQYIGGRSDQPLAKEGRQLLSEIREAGVWPDAEKVFVSPMRRCHETADILFPGVEHVVVPGLKEIDFGVFEQRSADDMKDDALYRAWVDSGCEDPIPEGENKEVFIERCSRAFSEVMKENRSGGPVVFVVHGGTIMAVLSRLGRPEKGYYDWYVKNGHGYACEWDGKLLHVEKEL